MGKSVRCRLSSAKWIRRGQGHEGFEGYLSSAGAGHIENSELFDIMSTSTAFAVITRNSPVLAWGGRGNGGKIPDNFDLNSKDVEQPIASKSAFLALRTD